MKIQAVKGTRDFYPPQMAVRNFIVDRWKAASLRNGFAEYDGPIFEYLKMYQVKSGQEIAEQLFNFTDRGGRDLAIRPEITPTLARMINQQINSLPRPIKWFSLPRLCRAERPQKGRLREFFQWNIDIIGVDDVIADAEIIFTAIDYLRSTGLTSKDVKARISSRKLLAAVLKNIGIPKKDFDSIYPVLDKKPKLPNKAFMEMLEKIVPDENKADKIKAFMEIEDISEIMEFIDNQGEEVEDAVTELLELVNCLKNMGIEEYYVFDPSIVRGLAYYTGVVFEVHDAVGDLRAICGGGRYDNLLKDFGGPSIPATGMGMGDCVLEILLREKGLLKDDQLSIRNLDYYVVYLDSGFQQKAVEITAKLRSANSSADFSYKSTGLKKQLKQAALSNSKKCIIIGDEFKDNQLVVKDMTTGKQELVRVDEFLAKLQH